MLHRRVIDRLWQVGFPGSRKPEVLHARMFVKEYSGRFHVWQGRRKRNRTGQDTLSCDDGPTAASADLMASSGYRLALNSCCKMGQDNQNFVPSKQICHCA